VADKSVADQLRKLGVKNVNVLVQMAERGQLLALKCEMPQCYHHKGRGEFDPVGTPGNKWTPSRDHYPILKSAGGKLVPENVRLSHTWCNNRDYGWRTQIRTLLAKGKSLAEIAETLNRKDVPPGPRHEPMDGRHGAQGLRVLVRVRRWVPLCATDESQVGPGRTSVCLREFVLGAGPDDELKSRPRGLDLPRCLAA
jgi:hypothetical protein